MNEQQLQFLEAFMIFCLLADSPPLSVDDKASVDKNLTLVATEGRKPNLQLSRQNESISLKNWGLEICNEMTELCNILDADDLTKPYTASLAHQIDKLNNVELTPSAKVLNSMVEQQLPFFKFAMHQANKHHEYFNKQTLTDEQRSCLEQASLDSIIEQQNIENNDTLTLEQFLAEYFSKD